MDDSTLEQVKESIWRKSLSPADQAKLKTYLASHPDARHEWNMELELTRRLEQLPAAPVSSNFTARVLQSAQKTPAPTKRSWFARLPQWLPRYALGVAMVCLGLLSVHQYNTYQQTRIARDLAEASRVAALPDPDWLKDFETINRLSQVQVADNDLLSTLQ